MERMMLSTTPEENVEMSEAKRMAHVNGKEDTGKGFGYDSSEKKQETQGQDPCLWPTSRTHRPSFPPTVSPALIAAPQPPTPLWNVPPRPSLTAPHPPPNSSQPSTLTASPPSALNTPASPALPSVSLTTKSSKTMVSTFGSICHTLENLCRRCRSSRRVYQVAAMLGRGGDVDAPLPPLIGLCWRWLPYSPCSPSAQLLCLSWTPSRPLDSSPFLPLSRHCWSRPYLYPLRPPTSGDPHHQVSPAVTAPLYIVCLVASVFSSVCGSSTH
ncbi:hypothetical protein BC829DRAFT_172768 [Chytridium lagenaria]|nr:hypothetical protein BC829DRAFT_172768 [Chytridium lagenaria]